MSGDRSVTRTRRLTAIAAAIGLASGFGVHAQQSPATWRAFRPLVIAAGDGDATRAVRYLEDVEQLLRKLDRNLVRDPAVAAIQDKLSASYEDLNLRRVFELLPERQGPWHTFALGGAPTSDGYRLFSGAPRDSARSTLGVSSSALRMRRIEAADEARYALQWHTNVGIGTPSWRTTLQGLRDALRLFGEQPDAAARAQLMAAERELQKAQPGLGPEDRAVLTSAWASFPATSQLISAIVHVDDVMVASPGADGTTHVRAIAHWNRERMRQRYPDVADFVERFGDLVDLDARLHDAAGNTLAALWFDSQHMQARLELTLRDGAIVPTRAGKPLTEVAPQYERMHAHVNLHAHALGIHMYTDDVVIDAQYRERERGMVLATQTKKTPRFRIEGAVFGVLPVAVLDWFVPGDIPGLARHMFEVAARSNDGRGIELSASCEAAADGGSVLEARVGVDVLDSALIRFGMHIAADRVIPDADQRADLRKLIGAYRDALALDVQRFSRYGAH